MNFRHVCQFLILHSSLKKGRPSFPNWKYGRPFLKLLGWYKTNDQLLFDFSSRSSGTGSGSSSTGGGSSSRSSIGSGSSHFGGISACGAGFGGGGTGGGGFNGGRLSLLRLARRQTSGQGQAQSSKLKQVVHFGGNFENGLTRKRPSYRLAGKVTRFEKLFFRRVTCGPRLY